LYDLASRPEYIEPLREEIESLISTEGWKKSTISKMRKLDSFVKESMRLHHLTSGTNQDLQLIIVGSPRMAMRDYTFSNGTTITKGTTVVAPILAIHRDENAYKNADEFDGFRYVKLREQYGDSPKYHSVNTTADFLHFGLGQHAWYAIRRVQLIIVPDGFSP
jgi:cytochrome P450